jgi:hypothetical protein
MNFGFARLTGVERPNDGSSHNAEGGTGKAEDAKLQDAGISPKRARENERQKKAT